ncbi:histidine kinase [Streptomyces toyocaensis]|uniref:Histidine kinase n=1 Tax=Streptomyces toyocaensis TaxID=55952 RepID=A0A081XXR9_STRTO|nr:SpoIIE family protein phosphatase [Streptomyces toyocaensis]KES08342.1 histidine kinase [Streptomyces toyocaensis]
MSPAAGGSEGPGTGTPAVRATFSALLEDSVEDLYDSAPCGYLSTLMDGTIAKINATLLGWLGLTRDEVVGRMRFSDLLTVGGKLYHETHFAPLLRMQGHLGGIALEMKTASGPRLPVLVTSTVKESDDGEPLLIRTSVFDATDRRAYENQLLTARRAADEARRQAEADREQLREALAVLQRSLLPAALPDIPGVEIACHYHTASALQVGGDFYDLFALDDDRAVFFLGDVCGKGPQAAALTSLTRHTLRAAALHDSDPVADLRMLNTVLLDRYTGDDPRYCTAVVGVLERVGDGWEVRMASGGHPPALVLRADGRAEYLPTRGGMLVGAVPEAHFVPVRTTLRPGDTLLLYTDGLTEARTGPDRDLYGYEALESFVTGLAPSGPGRVVDALTDLLRGFGDGLDDDTALLAIGVPARTDAGPGTTP